MTLTKADLVKSIRDNVRFKPKGRRLQPYLFPEMDYLLMSKKRASNILETLLEIIKSTLERGEDVKISGFGKFYVKFKWARSGRNPQTGKNIILPSTRKVLFKYSKKLREKMNTPYPD